MLQIKWLFITTYKVAPYFRVTLLARVPHAYIICENSIKFEFETVNQPGFEHGSLGPATLTIELHSIDNIFFIFILSENLHIETKIQFYIQKRFFIFFKEYKF